VTDEARERVRMDKWLWAARFYKTRRLATEACDAGHIRVGENDAKPGRAVNVGEVILIVKEALKWEVRVLALSAQRGPAAKAQLLYTELDESKKRRDDEIARRKAAAAVGPELKGRPTKRDRRDMLRYRGRDDEG
jgi:ribosome-associated heat shock protein Hsp15